MKNAELFVTIIGTIIGFLLKCWIVQLLWEIVAVEVFKFPELTYYQTICFIVLLSLIGHTLFPRSEKEKTTEEETDYQDQE